jgi:hypothetical protein
VELHRRLRKPCKNGTVVSNGNENKELSAKKKGGISLFVYANMWRQVCINLIFQKQSLDFTNPPGTSCGSLNGESKIYGKLPTLSAKMTITVLLFAMTIPLNF